MPQPTRRRVSTTILALCALASLAFTPAVSTESESAAEQGGECLEGYAYVEVLGSNHGITSTWCIHRTDCPTGLRVGPRSDGTSSAKLHSYVSVPRNTGTDVGCYL